MIKYVHFFLIIFLSSCLPGINKENNQKSTDTSEPITLIFAGDVMHHMPQLYAAFVPENESLDYTPCFQFIKPEIESADMAICNLETVLAGKPYTGYPQFSAPDELLYALKESGFDIIQLANNHILDRGRAGLERTVQLIKEQRMYPIGAFTDEEHRATYYPPIFTLKGVKIAFLNYTYGTNGLSAEKPNRINRLDSIQIIKDIHYAKMQGTDLVVALMHWGTEYHLEIDRSQQYWTDFLLRNQVDLIVGTHPHVVQRVDLHKIEDRVIPVYYSLGNFISNQHKEHTNGGIMAKVEIDPQTKRIIKNGYIPFYVYVGNLNKRRQYYLIPTQTFVENRSSDFGMSPRDSLAVYNFHTAIQNRLSNLPIDQ